MVKIKPKVKNFMSVGLVKDGGFLKQLGKTVCSTSESNQSKPYNCWGLFSAVDSCCVREHLQQQEERCPLQSN